MSDTTYLRQLALSLKVDGDVSGLLKFDQKLQMFVSNLRTSMPWKLVESIGRAMTDLSVTAARDAVQLDLRSKALRVTTQELQRLEYIAGSAGVANPLEKVTGLLQKIRGLETSAGTTAGGGSAGGLLGALGIRKGMNAEEKIAAIAKNLQKLPPALQNLAKGQRGLDELMHLLEQGPDEMRRLGVEAEALGLVWSSDTVKSGRQLEGQLFQLRAMQTGLTRELQAGLVPIALRVVGVFKAWAPVILDLAEKVLASFGVSTGDVAVAQKDLKKRLEEAQDAAKKFGEKLDDVAAVVAGVISALKILLEALLIRAVISRAIASLALLNGALLGTTAKMIAMNVASGAVTAGIGLILVELQGLYGFINDKPNIWSDMLEDPENLGGKYLKWLADVQQGLVDLWDKFTKAANAAAGFLGMVKPFQGDDEEKFWEIERNLRDETLTPQRRRQLEGQRGVLLEQIEAESQGAIVPELEYARAEAAQGYRPGGQNIRIGDVNQTVTVNGAQSPGATAQEIMAAQKAAQDQQNREAAAKMAPVYRQ